MTDVAPSPELEFTTTSLFAVEPEAVARARATRKRRLNVVNYPIVRLIGSTLLLAVVIAHNQFALPDPRWEAVVRYAAALEGYCFLSWGLLWFGYGRSGPVDLGLVFMVLDVAMWSLGIYVTGAEQSWLFFFPLMRVSDQSFLSFRRAVAFSVVAPVSFLLVVAYSAFVDGHVVVWGQEWAKAFLLVMCAVYLLVTGRNAERLRARTIEAVRVARRSIAELRAQSVELQAAKAAAEAASVAKSQFLANMSHELRTPLNAIIGYSEMLIEDTSDPAARDDLARIRSSGSHLLGLINDVLDVSKIEAGRMELHVEEFSIDALVRDCAAAAAPLVARRDNRLEIEAAALGNMHGDLMRVRQVLLNLLSNAAKFTEGGTIVLAVSRADGMVTFRVRDTGIGMSPAQLALLFQPFTQVDASPTRRYEGSGLGLTIAQRLVTMMGGTIRIDSAVGAGTTVDVALPAGGPPVGAPRFSPAHEDPAAMAAS